MDVECRVRWLPPWLDAARLLGPGAWAYELREDGARAAEARLELRQAADLAARLRGLGLGGAALELRCEPGLPRAAVRAARTEDARRRRQTTSGFDRPGTQAQGEARWSLTPASLALRMAGPARGLRVLDAGCGAGGNSIGFCRAGARVKALDSDPAQLRMARHNARVYGFETQIEFLQADAVAELAHAQADLLFVDPPWGEDWNRTVMRLEDLPLLQALLPLAERFSRVWCKLPPSFDPASLPGFRFCAWYGEADGDRRRIKFLLAKRNSVSGPRSESPG